MKSNYLAKTLAAVAIPAMAITSGCGTVKGLTHDVGYWSTKASNSIELKQQPVIVDAPKRIIPDGQGGYMDYNPKIKYQLSPRN